MHVRPNRTLMELVEHTLLTTLKGKHMRQPKLSLLTGIPDYYLDSIRQLEQYKDIAKARSTYIANSSYGNSNGSSHSIKTAASATGISSADIVGTDSNSSVTANGDSDDDGGDGDPDSDRRKSSSNRAFKTIKTQSTISLPQTGFIRLPQVLNTFPVSKSTWWAGIKSGKYPAGIKLSERVTAWRVEDIRALIDQFASNAS